MSKKVQAVVKLQIAAGKATPAPPVGTALGPQGVNIMDFCKNFNAKTAKDEGLIIPVVVTVYADRSYSFITKTPPAAVLLKRAANIAKGSAEPNKNKVGTVTAKQVEDIAKLQMPDLNAESLDAAAKTVRGTVVLPHGLGKSKKVLAIAAGDKQKEAQDAGADIVGGEEMVEKIQGGFMDFEAVVATPDMMRAVGKLGKVLGPRGLMPNPKTGTVTTDIAKAIREIKAGKVEFRVDKTGIIHAPVGKMSFASISLVENTHALVDSIVKAKPSAAKGKYLRSVTLSSTMGPGVRIDTTHIDAVKH